MTTERQGATTGRCGQCGTTVGRMAMRRHVAGCPIAVGAHADRKRQRQTGAPAETLLVEACVPRSPYWLLAAVAVNAPLHALDELLRRVWLECCGHLSEFEIDGVRYLSAGSSRSDGERSMSTKIGATLSPGAKFSHLYDFGTSTCLTLHVIDVLPWTVPARSAVLLANNRGPQWSCSSCGKPAVSIAMDYGEDIFYCAECGPGEEDTVLPIANSPRIGQCGYTGPGAPD